MMAALPMRRVAQLRFRPSVFLAPPYLDLALERSGAR